jgi:hypothetical protein
VKTELGSRFYRYATRCCQPTGPGQFGTAPDPGVPGNYRLSGQAAEQNVETGADAEATAWDFFQLG